MAEPIVPTEINAIESIITELSEIRRSLSSYRSTSASSLGSLKPHDDTNNTNDNLAYWEAIKRLPTFDRLRSSLFGEGGTLVDITKLGDDERRLFIGKLINHIEHDNLNLLRKIKKRTDQVGVKQPTIEVRYKNLRVEKRCIIVDGSPLPTLWNSLKNMLPSLPKLPGSREGATKISIINDVSGIIKPGRMTLLLGPPGCGKTTFLKALSGIQSLEVRGEVTYNGYKLEEFIPQKTAAYIRQYDLHIPEMTVRETLDFSARCQGVGSREEIMMEISRKEKEARIVPDPDIDTYMKATAAKGLKRTLQTDYILKILGLDICADTEVGDIMRRGVSGGQKKRLSTGEMIVGPNKALFMDSITNGLDSSTAYQVVAFLQQLAHITEATIIVSLLQPAPEAFDLFDDIILMAEGKIVFQGPRENSVKFFEHCGFTCPERKGVADFLQEVISVKDQAQYWSHPELEYSYISIDTFCKKFKDSIFWKKIDEELSEPFDKSRSHKSALCFNSSSPSKWELLKACMSREVLLMRRNSFLYVFKSCQIAVIAFVTMTVFLRTRMSIDISHANYYMGSLYYALVIFVVNGMPELSLTVSKLAVFYKQKELHFYPAWAYAIPASLLKIPLSILESLVWTCMTYYVIGYTPEPARFFRQLLLLFAVHWSSISLFRFLASIFQSVVASTTAGSFSILFLLGFGGFIISKPAMPVWLKWGFWVSPVSYGEIGLSLNEFLAPRWQKALSITNNTTIGNQLLESRGLNYEAHYFWISVAALFGFILLFNIGFAMALTFLKPPGSSRAVISRDKYLQRQGIIKDFNERGQRHVKYRLTPEVVNKKGRTVLPFIPLTITFENVRYYIDTPQAMKSRGFTDNRLQLLSDITGAFRPGVLTALMGITGAGKTTLLDVLSGRKTAGYIQGDIKVSGYPKVQDTFARISGYCEQSDIHSPNITVEESIIFSAWMRLDPGIDSKSKVAFVNEVIETIELDEIKDSLVGIPGVMGLSIEQRKRLTIAVELVANPSIIFMDEPTTGLDARAAAIVMRAVKNVADTGRTIVCTIHQPSIDIFESFDELILLKGGGRIIYSGSLGENSCDVIKYFESIPGIPKIKDNYNPATWMFDITCASSEAELNVDFAQIYKESPLHESNKELVKQLSATTPGSTDLHFSTRFSQNEWNQFKSCLWKQFLSYWRSPAYNLMRILHTVAASLLFGLLFWDQGKKLDDQQNLFNILGSMYIAVTFLGINNCSSVLPYITTERTVMYRERFAGMYSSRAFSLAQVTVEVPYLLFQSVAFVAITYPMIGYYGSAYKIFWYFYAMFCSMLTFNYLGMLLAALTPNFVIAAILASVFYLNFNMFAGYLLPKPRFPKWWIWAYYLCPTAWAINGMLTSQYGDNDKEISVFGETKTVSNFLKDYFDFHHDELYASAIVLLAFPFVLASLFAYAIGHLNFQRR